MSDTLGTGVHIRLCNLHNPHQQRKGGKQTGCTASHALRNSFSTREDQQRPWRWIRAELPERTGDIMGTTLLPAAAPIPIRTLHPAAAAAVERGRQSLPPFQTTRPSTWSAARSTSSLP
jgi:hypothetical protein